MDGKLALVVALAAGLAAYGGPPALAQGQGGDSVEIVRGTVPEDPPSMAPARAQPQTLVSGENIWVIDPEAGRITACSLERSNFIPIGEPETINDIRCRTEIWPQDAFHFLGMSHRM